MTASRAIAIRGLIVLLAVSAILMAFSVSARAATQLGLAAPNGTTTSACINCSFVQISDLGSPSYRAPAPSVVTEFGFKEGSTFGVNNTFTLQIWRPAGAGSFTLVAESAPLTMLGLVDNLRYGYVRMSMQVGDVIGTRINTPGGNTSPTHGAPVGNSAGGIIGNPAIGGTFTPANFPASRLNLYAIIEPDSDQDGFGDETQDLCLGNAVAGDTACSGSLVGPELTNQPNGGIGSGASGGLFVTTAVPVGLATAPFNGVIVRWRFKGSSVGGDHRLRVVRLLGGWDIQPLRSSDPLNSPGIDGRLVRSGETRIPIAAGEAIGLQTAPNADAKLVTFPGYTALQFSTPPTDGSTATANSEFGVNAPMISADIEPDADGDGFGDITQDQCPGNAGVNGVCPPTLAAVKSSNAKFRVNTKGAVISAAKRGTTISYTLGGAPANVKITVQRVVKGRKSGAKCVKQSRRNKRRKACNRYVKVHEFSRDAVVGTNSVAYSGRYKRGSRNRKLAPGRYRFSLTATNASGNATAVSKAVLVVKR